MALNIKDLPEFELYSQGVSLVAGVDEVGRGCLAGPVFAAAVIFPPNIVIEGVDDSKKLSATSREKLYEIILQKALAYSVVSLSSVEIDTLNIHRASLQAMKQAILGLSHQPEHVLPEHILIDGKFSLDLDIPQTPIIGGDAKSHTIAAASIIAKVSRDRLMKSLESHYPGFQFGKHKGYGTSQHQSEILKNGLTPIHRKSFCSKFMNSSL